MKLPKTTYRWKLKPCSLLILFLIRLHAKQLDMVRTILFLFYYLINYRKVKILFYELFSLEFWIHKVLKSYNTVIRSDTQ